jgi:hypothetical protein
MSTKIWAQGGAFALPVRNAFNETVCHRTLFPRFPKFPSKQHRRMSKQFKTTKGTQRETRRTPACVHMLGVFFLYTTTRRRFSLHRECDTRAARRTWPSPPRTPRRRASCTPPSSSSPPSPSPTPRQRYGTRSLPSARTHVLNATTATR